MIAHLPIYIPVIFGLTTLATLLLFFGVVKNSAAGSKANKILIGLTVWLILQAVLTLQHVYSSGTALFRKRQYKTISTGMRIIFNQVSCSKGK